MEIIYMILLFVAPGMTIRHVRKAITWDKQEKVNIYDFLFKVVYPSVAISFMTILILNCLRIWNTPTIEDVLSSLKYFEGMIEYSICALIVGIIGYCAWFGPISEKYIEYINKMIKPRHIKYTPQSTWQSVLSFDDIAGTWIVVSIYYYDKYLTSGMLHMNDVDSCDNVDILLEYTEKVEELKVMRPELFKNWYEFYSPASGLRVVFYEQQLIEEHWKEYFPE